MELKITKDRILEAASKCSTAKETLKTLFPEVFVEDKSVFVCDFSPIRFMNSSHVICRRTGGKNEYKAIVLPDIYNWEVIKDEHGILCLIPTKK